MIDPKKMLLVLLMFVVAGLLTPLTTLAGAEADDDLPRVGVFDSRVIALAYGRSNCADGMLTKVSSLHMELKSAKAAGDEDLVTEIEARGPALQEEIHGQVFFGASIANILDLISEQEMAAIAEAKGVVVITGDLLFAGEAVELVDVSFEMAAHFEPDKKTLGMMRDFMK